MILLTLYGMLILAAFWLWLFIARTSVKLACFAIDFCAVFIYTIYLLHQPISSKIANGNTIYFWDVLFGLIAVLIYGFLMVILSILLPRISKAINFVIVFLGVGIGICLATDFITFLLSIFHSSIEPTYRIQFLTNNLANDILYYVIFFLVSIPVWKKRMEYLTGL
ncbi:TPA: hypothetical protein U1069_000146 [Streptococcus suis]|nr:hypothetical protein [Streptococcus suis]HEM4682835.1 hypothetical protein [Streptococcus suis]HEM4777859.1 hypothetical protein [Streptococcus suis]